MYYTRGMKAMREMMVAAVVSVVVCAGIAWGRQATTEQAGQPAELMRLPVVNNAVLTELAAQVVLVHDTPGVGIAVVTKEGLHAFGVAGVRKSGAPDRLTTEDVFHLGSCGKMMTGVLLLRLEEQGRVDLSLPLGKVFPEWNVDGRFAGVTVGDLLRHRGGIAGSEEGEQLAFLRAGAGDPAGSRARLAERVLTGEAREDSGKEGGFAYSNVGYAIAGHVAERAAGMPFEALMQREVFAPLGITTAGFGAPGVRGKVLQPFGHVGLATPVEIGPFADNPPGFAPAGTMHMSLRDWGRFVAVVLGGGPEGFLGVAARAKLVAPPAGAVVGDEVNPTYAMGVSITGLRGREVYTHAGSNTIWFAQLLMVPAYEVGGVKSGGWAVMVATNHGREPGRKATREVIQELQALSK